MSYSNLSIQDQSELTKRFNAFNLDSETRTLASKFLHEYRQNSKQTDSQQLPMIINCAILAASKSQVITTIQGNSINGIGISITQLTRNLKSSLPENRAAFHIDDFLSTLKSFLEVVSLEQGILKELQESTEKFSFVYAFFKKYETLFGQISFLESTEQNKSYLRYLQNLGWLLYITAKSNILSNCNDLFESVFLLNVTLAHLLCHMPREISAPFFQKHSLEQSDQGFEQDRQGVYRALCGLLSLQHIDNEKIQAYNVQFLQFFDSLTQGTIKLHENSIHDLYCEKNIKSHFNKLDNFYLSRLAKEDFDERFFLDIVQFRAPEKQQLSFNKPTSSQSSNFLGVGQSADLARALRKGCPSYKTLSYEMSEKVTLKSNLNEIKFTTKNIPPSPYTRMLAATPMTRAFEMYSWLNNRIQISKNRSDLTHKMEECFNGLGFKVKEYVLPKVKSIVNKAITYEMKTAMATKDSLGEKKIFEKYLQATSLFLKVVEEISRQEEKLRMAPLHRLDIGEDGVYQALMAACIETVSFINNSSVISFEIMLKICEIQAFDFWKIILSFVGFDSQFPQPIKKHFYEIELRILLSLAWKKDSIVDQLIQSFMKSAEPKIHIKPVSKENEISAPKRKLGHAQDAFFKRVLHITAIQVQQLCDLLSLNEDTAEKIWTVMKYILSSDTTLLIQRHIDQLIFSAIYGVCKATNQTLKFQEIINKYQELPSFNKNDFSDIVGHVYIQEGKKADLVSFYNNVFISRIEPLLSSLQNKGGFEGGMKSTTPMIQRPFLNVLVMESPLRECLSNPHGDYMGMGLNNVIKSPMSFFQKTPSIGSFMKENISKRQIDFDDVQEGEELDIVMKKRKVSNSIVDKIIEQKSQDLDHDDDIKSISSKGMFTDQASPGERAFGFENSLTGVENNCAFFKKQKTFPMFEQLKPQKGLSWIRDGKMNLDITSPRGLLNLENRGMNFEEEGTSGTMTPVFGSQN